MFIGDYPNIHDGSLLYLVQLEGGNRLKVGPKIKYQLRLFRQGPGTVEYHYETKHFYVNSTGAMVSVVLGASTITIHRTCITLVCMEL